MKVEIYSREAVKELMKGEFPKNTAVISFCSPRKTRRAEEVRVYFGNVCDRVFNILIPDIDIEILGDYGYTYETYLAEADELAKFIYEAKAEGRDIICQCDFGQSRSAACAAAILQHFEGHGIDIFSDYRYYPNQLVYHKIFDALINHTHNENNNEICDCVSFRETQEHWKKTGYTPSAAEVACLIKKDKSLTLEEKHIAWTEIINTLPDCAFISKDYPNANIGSVHSFLSEYMALENLLLERFYKKESNAVYTYKVWCDEDGGWIGSDGPLYVDIEQALAEFQNDADLCPRLALFTKVYFGAENQRIYIYIRPDGAVIRVAADLIDHEENEYKIFYEIFYGMELVFKSKSEDEK